tara:strand:- start:274 stop:492 length:219 start_codon:yes stop_codon:yes gene_type:complete
MFKMKGPTFFKSPFKANVPTKEESKQKAINKIDKTIDEMDAADDRGDVLTANIAQASARKQRKEGTKLYRNK